MVTKVNRLLRHIWVSSTSRTYPISRTEINRITEAVRLAEMQTSAQFRVVIESALSVGELLANVSPRERAVEVFGSSRVWDTELNNGILLYFLTADRDFEIVADRGYNGIVDSRQWEEAANETEVMIRKSGLLAGILAGLDKTSEIARCNFPAPGKSGLNELPDSPHILR